MSAAIHSACWLCPVSATSPLPRRRRGRRPRSDPPAGTPTCAYAIDGLRSATIRQSQGQTRKRPPTNRRAMPVRARRARAWCREGRLRTANLGCRLTSAACRKIDGPTAWRGHVHTVRVRRWPRLCAQFQTHCDSTLPNVPAVARTGRRQRRDRRVCCR